MSKTVGVFALAATMALAACDSRVQQPPSAMARSAQDQTAGTAPLESGESPATAAAHDPGPAGSTGVASGASSAPQPGQTGSAARPAGTGTAGGPTAASGGATPAPKTGGPSANTGGPTAGPASGGGPGPTAGGPSGPSSQGVTDREITVGIIAPMSGAAGFLGENQVDAIRANFGLINDRGGVKGRRFNMVVVDYQFEPALAATAARKLVEQNKVFALISTMGDAEAPYVTSKGIPNLVFGPNPPAFSSKYPTTHVFGISTVDAVARMAYTLTKVMKLPIRSTAVLYDTNNVPIAPWVKYLAKAWEAVGVQVKSTDPFNLSDGDCTRIVLKMRSLGIDFWNAGPTLAWPACLSAASRQNYAPPVGSGGPYSGDASFVAQAGGASNNYYAQTAGVQIRRNKGQPYPYEPTNTAPLVDDYVNSMRKYSPKSADTGPLENIWTQLFWTGPKLLADAVAAQPGGITWEGVNRWITAQTNYKTGLTGNINFTTNCKSGAPSWIFQWKAVSGGYEESDWQPYGGPIEVPVDVKNGIVPGAGECYRTAMADAELH